MSVGPAGENRLLAASIAVTDLEGRPSRHAGRGGLGAVMGGKGLKAVVIDDAGAGGVTYADREAFKKAAEVFRTAIMKHPVTMKGGGLSTFGTNVLVSMINAVCAFPTRNFSAGQFENAAKISGEALHKIITERGGKTTASGCTSCIIQCSNVYLDKDKNYLTSALEYETVWAHGANLGVDDLDAIAAIDRLCDDYGLDTIDTGCAIGVAMAAGLLPFGDASGAINLIHEAGRGTPLGRIIGGGAALAGRAFGVENVPAVKGQALSAYDPRGVKGQGVTFATSPMGADHTAGYAASANLMRIGGKVPPLAVEGQVELSRKTQINAACLDSAGLCSFVSFAVVDNADAYNAIPRMISALRGTPCSLENFLEMGRNVLRTEVGFNRQAGFTSAHDRLPAFLTANKIGPQGAVFDVPPAELDRIFDFGS
jgi:aldehyde:ferredoxin oxidoreductase